MNRIIGYISSGARGSAVQLVSTGSAQFLKDKFQILVMKGQTKNFGRRVAAVLLLACWFSSCWSAAPAPKPMTAATLQANVGGEKLPLTAFRAESWQYFIVAPRGRIEFNLKGFSPVYGGSGHINPGRIPVSYYMTDGKDYWLLVPYIETGRLDGREFDTADPARSAYVGVNYASGEIFPRIVLLKLTLGDHLLKPNNRSLAFSRQIQFRTMASVQREGFFSEEASRRALAGSQSAFLARQKATAAANLPLVDKIGAKICKSVGAVVYVGFTEGRSPDNDKIQIRVADAFFLAYPTLKPDGFTSSIIWDSPGNWQPCE